MRVLYRLVEAYCPYIMVYRVNVNTRSLVFPASSSADIFKVCRPGRQCSSKRYMNVRPLSLVKRSHFPSTSARTFLNAPKLSFTENTIRLALLKLEPSAKPTGEITGGSVSTI